MPSSRTETTTPWPDSPWLQTCMMFRSGCTLLFCARWALGSVGLWPRLAPPPSPARSPCTTAWGTRGLWVPPPSASPAAGASAAQTTAPGGECALQEGAGPRQPAHPPPNGPALTPTHLRGPCPSQSFPPSPTKRPRAASTEDRPLPQVHQGEVVCGATAGVGCVWVLHCLSWVPHGMGPGPGPCVC